MQEIANASPRRGIARRVGAAVLALAVLLVLAGCHEARGWGSIGGIPDEIPVFNGKAEFAFTYHCDPKKVNGRVYTYRDTSTIGAPPFYRGLWISGVVTRTMIDTNDDGILEEATSCQEIMKARAAQFRGKYRSLEKKYCNAKGGEFTIMVYDQDNPILPAGDFTGDAFSIELFGGPYTGYSRAGYIEKGNIYAN